MPTIAPARRPKAGLPDRDSGGPDRFILYVEGPRDRSILRAWAKRLIPERAVELLAGAVILGGRRPARAVEHFRAHGGGARGLCLLDRDGADAEPESGEDGLQFFTWGRRHIESYLLVPAAIRRALALGASDHRVETALGGGLPDPDDAAGWRALDAKRLLGERGPLATALGRSLPLARIARATREDELHEDVHLVFAALRRGLSRITPARTRRARPLRPR